jgi:predicted kinase
MAEASETPSLLILVSGLPASGKTSLAEEIGKALALPIFNKDAIKELLFDTLGWSSRDWSKKLGAASTELLWFITKRHLQAGASIVLESNFVKEFADPQIAKLRGEWPVRVIEVHCVAAREVLVERYRKRAEDGERHPGHMEWDEDDMEKDLIPQIRSAKDLTLDQAHALIEVDTGDFDAVDTPSVIAQVRAALAS